ncbi:amidinotransferase [Luteimonas yindakuii]|uniref:arginine deiminase-related protein n=1 Tax=Luteimonas yindakuii TaxID=2565782 RepID=UPI0011076FE4|nr:arginine deiminase-related protein [Luteimonas yindakuii]QCU72392.1 amidinotransferase [Luteimonas yindakuii]
MITRDVDAFLAVARAAAADFGPATARGAFLVSPDGFSRAAESARDNSYMADAGFDARAACAEHAELVRRIRQHLPVEVFPGDPAAPDGVFPNNVFGTSADALVIGRMRHPVRRREAARRDIRTSLGEGRRIVDLSLQPHPCELTGALVIDRSRGLGICGLSERCSAEGAALMHTAFGLRATLVLDLAPGEYHTNVVLAVLAGRAALLCPDGFAQPAVAHAVVQALYGDAAIVLDADARAAFVANAIALTPSTVWMSARAAAALPAAASAQLAHVGFQVEAVPLPAIEAAGGSLRCCVAEIF